MIALAEKKLELIRDIFNIEDEKTLSALVEAYEQITGQSSTVPGRPVKSIRQKFDAGAIRRRRGKKGHDKDKIMRLIREMNVQEPIEELLSQLSK